MPPTNAQIEDEIKAKNLVSPRVTPDMIDKAIAGEEYFTPAELLIFRGRKLEEHDSFRLLTICVLKLKNGFTVIGESACASPQNFDAEIGKKLARQAALSKVWALEGYLLKSQLADGSYQAKPNGER